MKHKAFALTFVLGAFLSFLNPLAPAAFSHFNAPVTNGDLELVSQIGGVIRDLAVQGDYAYVGVGPRLVILNVANPGDPVVVGQTDFLGSVSSTVCSVAIAGDYAYVGAGSTGLYIIDVTNPANPAVVGFYDTAYRVRGVAVDGDSLGCRARYTLLRGTSSTPQALNIPTACPSPSAAAIIAVLCSLSPRNSNQAVARLFFGPQ